MPSSKISARDLLAGTVPLLYPSTIDVSQILGRPARSHELKFGANPLTVANPLNFASIKVLQYQIKHYPFYKVTLNLNRSLEILSGNERQIDVRIRRRNNPSHRQCI